MSFGKVVKNVVTSKESKEMASYVASSAGVALLGLGVILVVGAALIVLVMILIHFDVIRIFQ